MNKFKSEILCNLHSPSQEGITLSLHTIYDLRPPTQALSYQSLAATYLLTEAQLPAETHDSRVVTIAMAIPLQVGGAVAEQVVQGGEQGGVVLPSKACARES